MAKQTNVLALPLVAMDIMTGNSEDWIDSIKYVVTQEIGDITDWPQMDLRGIEFEMEVRRSVQEHEVIIHGSTVDGTLAIGAPPNIGYLLIHIPYDIMKYKFSGNYIGDIRASDDDDRRVIVQFTLNIFDGVTRTP